MLSSLGLAALAVATPAAAVHVGARVLGPHRLLASFSNAYVHRQQYAASSASDASSQSIPAPKMTRAGFLNGMLAVAGSQPLSALAAPVPVPQMDDKTLQQELVQILRVQEAAAQEARLVKTGKYRELQRLNVKRAVGMMIDNYDLSGRFVRASTVAPRDKANAAASFGNTAVESLVQILEYFQVDLVANELTKEQQNFVLKALKSTSTSIDSFLALMPSNVVTAAKKQIEEENELNLKEFPEDAYLNPTPTVGELVFSS